MEEEDLGKGRDPFHVKSGPAPSQTLSHPRKATAEKQMPYIDDYNRSFRKNAQILRKNMTAEEKKLWYRFLKYLPITVNRQKTLGNYIVDFYISEHNLVIELDGIQHAEKEHVFSDCERDKKLRSMGCTVLRFCNSTIQTDFDSVCAQILVALGLKREDMKHKARSF